ncbi:uncharacterized protein Gm51460 [Mus musculus]|uniref:uncharacterized protein Gm51460 n=1 Tax=Mus musculus TaxID=10090 RepID=UPI0011AEB4AC|nr:uncharacterized protein Gm51460 [Mus musculus]
MVLARARAIRTENQVARGHTFLMHQSRFPHDQTGGRHHAHGPPGRSRTFRGSARGLSHPLVLRTDPRPERRRPSRPGRPQTKRTATIGGPRGRTRQGHRARAATARTREPRASRTLLDDPASVRTRPQVGRSAAAAVAARSPTRKCTHTLPELSALPVGGNY